MSCDGSLYLLSLSVVTLTLVALDYICKGMSGVRFFIFHDLCSCCFLYLYPFLFLFSSQLMLQKESLADECTVKVGEIGTWTEVVQASSIEEVQELVNVLPSNSSLSIDEKEALLNYDKLHKKAFAYSKLGNIT